MAFSTAHFLKRGSLFGPLIGNVYIDEQNQVSAAKVEHFAFHAGGAVIPDDRTPEKELELMDQDEFEREAEAAAILPGYDVPVPSS